MIPPALAAARFLSAAAVGVLLGLWYGFLRPLRPRFTTLSDGAFLLGAAWGWLEVAFHVCGGDMRFGYLAGMALGGVLWDRTLGRGVNRLFFRFWKMVGGFFIGIRKNLKIFSEKMKKRFASVKKWVTIK